MRNRNSESTVWYGSNPVSSQRRHTLIQPVYHRLHQVWVCEREWSTNVRERSRSEYSTGSEQPLQAVQSRRSSTPWPSPVSTTTPYIAPRSLVPTPPAAATRSSSSASPPSSSSSSSSPFGSWFGVCQSNKMYHTHKKYWFGGRLCWV